MVRHYFDEQDWERIVQNRKYLTQQGRDENARKLAQKEGRRQLQSNGFHAAGARTWNVVVCLMNWSNHGGRTSLKAADVQKLFMGSGRDPVLHPGGSINDYLQAMSQGQFKLNVHVADWVKTSKSESMYTQDGSQGRTQEIQESFEPVLKALDNSNFDFSKYDSDGDQEIDLTVFLHSGYDGLHPGNDCETGASPLQRIASHYRLRSTESSWVSKTGYKLGTYVVAPAYYGSCDADINGMGVITHEIIHAFGIPDLYDTGEFATTGYLGGIDRYDIMANPWGNQFNSRFPGPLMGWTRMELGWVTPTEIDGDGVYTIGSAEETSDLYVIKKGYYPNEYLLLENRQAIAGGFDENFFEPGGITIYHVDENIWAATGFQSNMGNTPKGGPFQAGWPGNGKHYPVALLQADGLYELEQNINGGDSGDLWNSPDQILGPGNGEAEANSATYPNTDGYAWGTIAVTGLTIKNFQYTQGKTMSFEVSGLGASSGPPPTDPPVAPPTNPPTDPPTNPPVVPPTNPPVAPPTNPPVAPPTNPPTDPPALTPTEAPMAPTEAPIDPTDAPVAPTEVPVVPTEAPIASESTPAPSLSTSIDDTTNAPTTVTNATETTSVPTPSELEAFSGLGCDEAFTVDTDGSLISGSTADASHTIDTAFCGAPISGAGQWYTFSGTGTTIEIDACNQKGSENFNVAVSVFSGSSCDMLACVSGLTFEDQLCSPTDESKLRRFLQPDPSPGLSLATDAGMTYFLFVHGYDESTGGSGTGGFQFSINQLNTKVLNETTTSSEGLPLGFVDAESIFVISGPPNGKVDVRNNTVIYTSDKKYTGTDSFEIQVCDTEGICEDIIVNVEVTADETAKDKDKDNAHGNDSGDGGNDELSSSSSKNYLYALLVLLLLPLVWIFRKRLCCCLPCFKEKAASDDWDPSQPTGKSTRNLGGEQPFKDEEVNDGYTDDTKALNIEDAEDSHVGDDDDDEEEDSESDDDDAEETNESYYEETVSDKDGDKDSDDGDDDDDDSQEVQGDSDDESENGIV
jgi:M6 family metalloprotease-like protein